MFKQLLCPTPPAGDNNNNKNSNNNNDNNNNNNSNNNNNKKKKSNNNQNNQQEMSDHHAMDHGPAAPQGGMVTGQGRAMQREETRSAAGGGHAQDFMRNPANDGRLRSSGGLDHHQHQQNHHPVSYDDPRLRGGEDLRGNAGQGEMRMLNPAPHHRGAGDMEAPRSAVGGHHHSQNLGHHSLGHREDVRGGLRNEEPRGLREDPRLAQHMQREDPRGLREDPRQQLPLEDRRSPPRYPDEHQMNQMSPQQYHHHHGLQQPPHQQHQQHQARDPHGDPRDDRRMHHNQYMLPWEDGTQEEAPSQDYGSAPIQYANEVDDKGALVDGRRSRQRRGGDPPDNDMYDPRRAEDPRRAGQTDRVAPNNADRGL
ncbi:unnamed protein product, partial [Polarella glacialis]